MISQVVIDSNISHDELILVNNMPKEFYEMKEETKSKLYIKQYYWVVWSVEKIQ